MIKINISEKNAHEIVTCIEEAINDNIREDIANNDLTTTNSVPSRIWDFINRNLKRNLNFDDCIVADTNRGPWQMTVLYDRDSQCIYTFMREKRFREIKRAQTKRNKMHYVDMLAKQFNSDLVCQYQQTSFFENHKFDDEDKLSELVQQLLKNLVSDLSLVKNHVIVLFDTVGFELISVRAVMITPSLDIAKNSDANWSNYISHNSIIVDKVDNINYPQNVPNRGLKLTAKATQRKQSNAKIRDNDNIVESKK